MTMDERSYLVTFRESAVITEQVWARTEAEAIRRVKDGLGERVEFDIDETRDPTSHTAYLESDDPVAPTNGGAE